MKYYQSEFCIRKTIELNWCGHYKNKKLYCFQKTDYFTILKGRLLISSSYIENIDLIRTQQE